MSLETEQCAALILGAARHAYMVNMDSGGVGGELWNDSVRWQEKESWSHGGHLGGYLLSNLLINHSFICSWKKKIY